MKRWQRTESMRQRVGVLCHYCPMPAETSDHIVPLAHGGSDAIWNRVPACKACNQAKADVMPTHDCDTCRRAINRHRVREGRI